MDHMDDLTFALFIIRYIARIYNTLCIGSSRIELIVFENDGAPTVGYGTRAIVCFAFIHQLNSRSSNKASATLGFARFPIGCGN